MIGLLTLFIVVAIAYFVLKALFFVTASIIWTIFKLIAYLAIFFALVIVAILII